MEAMVVVGRIADLRKDLIKKPGNKVVRCCECGEKCLQAPSTQKTGATPICYRCVEAYVARKELTPIPVVLPESMEEMRRWTSEEESAT